MTSVFGFGWNANRLRSSAFRKYEWSAVSPGRGYRLLSLNERIEHGDEFLNGGNGIWYPTKIAGYGVRDGVSGQVRAYRRRVACHAASDGECSWKHCPQKRDGEPDKTGRHCPLDRTEDWEGE